ncbi:MAG: hypothetical protein ACYDAG_10215 [Chloroflexota bacterium]
MRLRMPVIRLVTVVRLAIASNVIMLGMLLGLAHQVVAISPPPAAGAANAAARYVKHQWAYVEHADQPSFAWVVNHSTSDVQSTIQAVGPGSSAAMRSIANVGTVQPVVQSISHSTAVVVVTATIHLRGGKTIHLQESVLMAMVRHTWLVRQTSLVHQISPL